MWLPTSGNYIKRAFSPILNSRPSVLTASPSVNHKMCHISQQSNVLFVLLIMRWSISECWKGQCWERWSTILLCLRCVSSGFVCVHCISVTAVAEVWVQHWCVSVSVLMFTVQRSKSSVFSFITLCTHNPFSQSYVSIWHFQKLDRVYIYYVYMLNDWLHSS